MYESSEGYRTREPLDYSDKMILAPMVRVGTLPMRILTKQCGADITYSEEIIAKKLQNCKRIVNQKLNTFDYVEMKPNPNAEGNVVYRTCMIDRPNIVQLGVAEASTALEAAKVVFNDVDGIDINCGCPKHFSIQGGMGAALLSTPEKIKDIVSTLLRNLPTKNITCKVRLLDTVEKTVDLLKAVSQTGVPAIAIHSRYIHERPTDPSHWDLLKAVVEGANLDIPLIANGDIFRFEDIQKVKSQTGVSSVMIARGAIINPSIFSGPNPRSITKEIIPEYLRLATITENHHLNTKYVVQQIMKENGLNKGPGSFFDRLNRSKTTREICQIWSLESNYDNWEKTGFWSKVGEPSSFHNSENNDNNNDNGSNSRDNKLSDIGCGSTSSGEQGCSEQATTKCGDVHKLDQADSELEKKRQRVEVEGENQVLLNGER
eukprot:TRINITY_DN4211_c1_g1_i1.p1 TRINITY_DN4211_c1_g1~~TRINITY_DN4211_c1_g1_i1.p1  ORF type:complete len:432 (-),score=69.03 TRINITY_DN4211_c1_g1_i1:52-1347(-)